MIEEPKQKRLTFDPTINAGHLLTFAGMLIAVLLAWGNLDKRVVVAGGVHGGKYKVTVSLTTDASPVPIRKEVDFIIEVKDV